VVARELAARLGSTAVDLDREIVSSAGKSIAAVFAEDGEGRFRALESAALAAALGRPGAQVLAPGGGIVTREENRDALRRSGALLVFLEASPETLARRVEADVSTARDRPALVAGGALAEARALLAAREPHYRALAHLVVDTDALTVAEVASRIEARVREG
jgi:shikimate kinase